MDRFELRIIFPTGKQYIGQNSDFESDAIRTTSRALYYLGWSLVKTMHLRDIISFLSLTVCLPILILCIGEIWSFAVCFSLDDHASYLIPLFPFMFWLFFHNDSGDSFNDNFAHNNSKTGSRHRRIVHAHNSEAQYFKFKKSEEWPENFVHWL